MASSNLWTFFPFNFCIRIILEMCIFTSKAQIQVPVAHCIPKWRPCGDSIFNNSNRQNREQTVGYNFDIINIEYAVNCKCEIHQQDRQYNK